MSTTHQRTVKDRHMVRDGGGRELMQHAGVGEGGRSGCGSSPPPEEWREAA